MFLSNFFHKIRLPRWGSYNINEMSSEYEEGQMISFLSLTDLNGHYEEKVPTAFKSTERRQKLRPLSCIESLERESTTTQEESYLEPNTFRPRKRPVSCIVSCDTDVTAKNVLIQNLKNQRPLSTVSQLSCLSPGVSSGYSSMSESQDSLTSLARNGSIQRRLHSIHRRRRHLGPNERKRCDKSLSTESLPDPSQNLDNSENGGPDLDQFRIPSLENARPKSMNFEDLRLVGLEAAVDEKSNNLAKLELSRPRSVYFEADDEESDADTEDSDRKINKKDVHRQKSIQLKAWEMRRQRRALGNKKKQALRLQEKQNNPPVII